MDEVHHQSIQAPVSSSSAICAIDRAVEKLCQDVGFLAKSSEPQMNYSRSDHGARWLRSVRWPDGRLVSYDLDRTAFALKLVEIGAIIVLMVDLILDVLPHGVILAPVAFVGAFGARWRLEKALRDALSSGESVNPDDYISFWDWTRRYLLRNVEHEISDLESRAQRAANEGDEQAARKYLDKAKRQSDDARQYRIRSNGDDLLV